MSYSLTCSAFLWLLDPENIHMFEWSASRVFASFSMASSFPFGHVPGGGLAEEMASAPLELWGLTRCLATLWESRRLIDLISS